MNKQKMIESESQLKRMTKNELKQWLTKHDQRLPPIDKKKPYYFERAVSYFKLLQKEQANTGFSSQSNQNVNGNKPRSKIKHKTKVINKSRTKKKTSSQSSSRAKTPTRTQRRHSSILTGSPSPSLTKSKRKIIKVKRKTPTKQSPSLTKSLKKKRDRVRRVTADPASLMEIEKDAARERDRDLNQSSDSDVDITDITQKTEAESENGGDFNNYQQFQRADNLKKRQFVCSRDPESMTIRDLQVWLDQNNIDFKQREKKATYVKLVRKHSLPTSFNSNGNSSYDANSNLAAKQKKYVSPVRKIMNDAPLPRNIRQSPLTPPRDDEKMQSRSRIPERRQSQRLRENQQKEGRKSGVLLTPALNKTGIRPIETPEKAAMRDEIQCLLNLDDDDLNPVFAIKGDGDNGIDNDGNNNDTNGITPGGPSSYDPEVLNDVLSDIRKDQQKQKYEPPQQQQSPLKSAANDMPNIDIERELNEVAYNNESDMDSKENDCINVGNVASNSFFDNLMNRFSPYKQVTQSAIKDAANSVFKVHDTSILRKGKRTIPSPIDDGSPEQHYHGNNHHSGSVSMSPPIPQQQQQQEASPNPMGNNGNFRNDVLIPPSPIENYKQKMTDYVDDEDDIPQTPAVPHSHYNQYQQQQQFNIINPRRTPAQKKQKSPPKHQQLQQQQQMNIRRRHQGIGRNHGVKIGKRSMYDNNQQQQIQDSPGISPSTNIDSSFKLNNQNNNSKPSSFDQSGAIKNQQPKSNGMGKIFAKFTFFALIIAAISCFFILFDGMTHINDIMDEVTEFINNFNAEEETLFCDTNKATIAGLPLPNDFICHSCPKHASFCQNGRVQCKTNYILQDDKCILDGITVKFAFEIKNQVVKILSQRRGQSECGEIMDDDFSMTQDELMSNTEIIDERKKAEAFDYFEKNILPESPIVSRTKHGRYYSHIAIKSPKCRIKEWAIDNILGLIATFIIVVIVFGIWRKQKAKQRERAEIQNMTDEIYKMLEEFGQFENGQHIPVDRIRQRIKPQSNKVWDEAEKNIQTDIRIQKSMRMIDGLQRKCWRVSISKLSSAQSQGNNNKYKKWSPAEQNQRQQQEWNFNNNNNNNNGNNDNGGFRFPPHSKRSMGW